MQWLTRRTMKHVIRRKTKTAGQNNGPQEVWPSVSEAPSSGANKAGELPMVISSEGKDSMLFVFMCMLVPASAITAGANAVRMCLFGGFNWCHWRWIVKAVNLHWNRQESCCFDSSDWTRPVWRWPFAQILWGRKSKLFHLACSLAINFTNDLL